MSTPDNEKRMTEKDTLLSREEAAQKLNGAGAKIEGRLTTALAIAVFACTFGSSFQFGYHIGNVNAPQKLIVTWYSESHFRLWNESLSEDRAQFMWSISVGIFAIGGMIGGLASGWFADKLGRKKALLYNNAIAIAGAAFLTFAKSPADVYYLIIIGRFIMGLNSGLNTGFAPLYLTEVSPVNLRGSIGSIHQLQVTVAILVSQILGLPYIFGTEKLWPLIFAFTIVPVIVQLAVLPFCPESPKFTLINRGNVNQAERDLKKLRGSENVAAELESFNEEAAKARSQPKVSFGDMIKDQYRWPLFIAVMLMFSQQLTGINAAMFFSTKIFTDAGLTGSAPVYATIAMGALNVVQTMISVYLVDHPKFGRRILHLGGLIGMFCSTVLLTVALTFSKTEPGEAKSTLSEISSFASIIFVILFVISFATGPGSIPWFFVSEVFPSYARGNANSIAVVFNWASVVIISVSFLPLTNMIGHNTFLVFAAIQAFFIVFLWKAMPETKGKSIEQIQTEMKRR